jgi:hypothetical protein
MASSTRPSSSSRSCRLSTRLLRAAVVAVTFSLSLVAGSAVVTATASPAAASPVYPPTPKTLNYMATLQTSGQNMWGSGAAAPPHDVTDTWFDQTWNASGGFDSVTHVDVNLDPTGLCGSSCTVNFGDYGASLTASSSGELGMSDTVHGLNGGTVGVKYPMSLAFTAPADNTYAPGDTVTIASTAPTPQPGASITNTSPSISSISLDGKFRFAASVDGSICVVSCASGNIFSFDLPGGGTTANGPLFSLSANDLLLIQGLGLAKCFGLAEGVLLGASTYPNAGDYCNNGTGPGNDNGYLKLPNPQLGNGGAGTTIAGTQLSASATDPFVVVPISAAKWIGKLADLPTGFPNLSATFKGVGVSYTTLDAIFTAVISETQAMTFSPTVNASLDFGQSVVYTVTDSLNNTVQSSTAAVVTFPLGDSVHVQVPAPLTVTPTVAMGNSTFTNRTTDSLSGTAQFKALSFFANIPSCCSGVFSGFGVNVGPLYDSGALPLASTDIATLANSTWELGGFNAERLSPFTLTPDPLPVPTVRTVNPIEGTAFNSQTVASFHDPDTSDAGRAASADYTASISWGDGHTSIGTISGTDAAFTVAGSNTYAEEGGYSVNVTVTDTATPTVISVAHSTAQVADAALSVTDTPTLTSTEGAATPAGLRVATFADADPAGTVADYTATVNWGDGQTSSATVQAAAAGGFDVLAPSHTYEEEGNPTVTVSINDAGGAKTTALPAMATADAALHAGAPVTNDTLTGSGTPVLLWPNPGNAVLATFTDDDPHGTSSDYSAVVTWGDGTSSAATVSAAASGFKVTGSHSYANAALGVHPISILITDSGGSYTTATTTLLAYALPSSGLFAVGDTTYRAAAPNTLLNYWGAQWWKQNVLSGGGAPASFKGYTSSPPAFPAPPATCPSGSSFVSAPGNSSVPPTTVPSYMPLLVTSQVSKDGSTISSNSATHWVIVATQPGYDTSPGSAGYATVVAQIC